MRRWQMNCIGPGPGPKNVLAEDTTTGHRIVVPYAIWKHKLSKEELPMSDQAPKTYITTVGIVQKFGEKPVTTTREANGQQVSGFTIKTVPNQAYVGISLWPEFAALVPYITEGMFVAVDGAYTKTTGQDGREFHNISATRIAVLAPVQRAEREIVNAQPAAVDPTAPPAVAPETAAAPTAAQPQAAAAPSGSPF